MTDKILFTVPIGGEAGSFECKTVADKVYLLSFSSPPDNRVLTEFLKAYKIALDIIDYKYPPGVLITTSAIEKFFSNGFNLEHNAENPRFMDDYMLPLCERILT
jgi:hypothetical protein